MDLRELIELQKDFDEKHGWSPDPTNAFTVSTFLVRDLVGLFGEMGEFANAVKKIQLASDSDLHSEFSKNMPQLKEELVDFMIYVLRFAAYLEVDLEKEYIEKLRINDIRFKHYLTDQRSEDS